MKKLLLFLSGFLLLSSCRTGVESTDKPVISVSIIPQQFFIEQLAGNLVEVNVMIPSGASPATYEPTVSQLEKLDGSSLYMRIGYVGFEQSWMDKIKSVDPGMKIVDLSKGVEIILEEEEQEIEEAGEHHEHSHHGPDPHIWMSVINAGIIADNILEELQLLLPDKKEYLQARHDQFGLYLDTLHASITGQLEGVENRAFMIYHPALTYFARDYGLEQLSLEKEGKSPSPAHLKQMTDLARVKNIRKILIQSQFDRKNAEILSRETGAHIVQFDPLSLHWGEQMLYIAEQLNSPAP
ncbi:MAG: zinc ABC transporter substrate-binding protein [Bacteroidales bacterium]|nr:zinc ABC transporter substrate-binding protein [Bacteroidales bacterium]